MTFEMIKDYAQANLGENDDDLNSNSPLESDEEYKQRLTKEVEKHRKRTEIITVDRDLVKQTKQLKTTKEDLEIEFNKLSSIKMRENGDETHSLRTCIAEVECIIYNLNKYWENHELMKIPNIFKDSIIALKKALKMDWSAPSWDNECIDPACFFLYANI